MYPAYDNCMHFLQWYLIGQYSKPCKSAIEYGYRDALHANVLYILSYYVKNLSLLKNRSVVHTDVPSPPVALETIILALKLAQCISGKSISPLSSCLPSSGNDNNNTLMDKLFQLHYRYYNNGKHINGKKVFDIYVSEIVKSNSISAALDLYLEKVFKYIDTIKKSKKVPASDPKNYYLPPLVFKHLEALKNHEYCEFEFEIQERKRKRQQNNEKEEEYEQNINDMRQKNEEKRQKNEEDRLNRRRRRGESQSVADIKLNI